MICDVGPDTVQFGKTLHSGAGAHRFEFCCTQGGVSERFKVLVLKTSVAVATMGSNPIFSIFNIQDSL